MHPGKQQSLRLPITVSSGAGIGTVSNSWDLCRWLRIKPITESDTYDLTIKDADGMLILSRTAQLGTFSERVEASLAIISTITIANASQDGTYIVKFDMN